MEPIVSNLQAPIVMIGSRNLWRMDITAVRASFAARMHELCDALEIPRGHGRNAALGRICEVTPNAARKWLLGLSYPEMPLAVAMCNKAGVNVVWLLQGTPPKKGEQVDPQALHLAEALEGLPVENRNAVLDYMRFQIGSTGNWFASEALRSYMTDIEALRRQPGPSVAHRKPTSSSA